MTSIAIHVLVAIRNATITEQETHLMGSLRTQGDEIPEHVRVLIKTNKNNKFRNKIKNQRAT